MGQKLGAGRQAVARQSVSNANQVRRSTSSDEQNEFVFFSKCENAKSK